MRELKTILHVDDDDDILDLARMGFELDGELCVYQCRSGAEALADIGRIRPDLLLLDVMMPDMDGITLLSTLRAQLESSDHLAVFMTGSVAANRTDNSDALGVIGHIRKPFDPLTLAPQVKSLWIEHFSRST